MNNGAEGLPIPEPRDDSDRKVIHDVETHGWHVVNILPESETPGWAFTIGLEQSFSHAEIVVFGLDSELAHLLLNDLGEAIRAGQAFEPAHLYAGYLEGADLTFRPVQPSWYRPFLGTAIWFNEGPSFSTLQLIWPDKSERFPWQDGFDPNWSWAQPMLFESDPRVANAEALLRSLENTR